MNYGEFRDAVHAAGLEPRTCTPIHWQILGGRRRVNIWPNTKRGFCFQAAGKAVHRRGQLQDAISAAEPHKELSTSTPPWKEADPVTQTPHVGVIRRLWRWLW